MSSLVGYVTATFDQIRDIAWEGDAPLTSNDASEKVSTEFVLDDFEAGEIRIYDWKHYDAGVEARSGYPIQWHIGASSQYAIEVINERLDAEGHDMVATTCR
jgi:hypothetical protein